MTIAAQASTEAADAVMETRPASALLQSVDGSTVDFFLRKKVIPVTARDAAAGLRDVVMKTWEAARAPPCDRPLVAPPQRPYQPNQRTIVPAPMRKTLWGSML